MNVGVETIARSIEMLGAKDYTDFKNLAVKNKYGTDEINLSQASEWGNKAFNMMKDSKGRYVSTNWMDELFRTGVIQNHTVSIQGGTEAVSYYMSGNFTDQDGIVLGDKYRRFGGRANVSAKATNWLKVGFNMNYTHGKTSSVDGSRNGQPFTSSGLPRAALILPSNIPVRNEDGSLHVTDKYYVGYGGNTINPESFYHPLGIIEDGNTSSVTTSRIIGSAFAEVTPVRGLSLKTQIGVDYSGTRTSRFSGPTYQTVPSDGLADEIYGTTFNYTWTNTATYDLTVADKHHFNFMVGMEALRDTYEYFNVTGKVLLNPSFSGLGGGYQEYTGGGDNGERTMASYFGRINYDYKSKYLISGNFRSDGYSPLGDNNRWGNFWGVSAAWRISEEAFFEPARQVLNELKIKASYGTVGNSSIGYYPSKTYYKNYTYGGENGFITGNIGDSNLKWETSHKYDVGFSAQFLRNISLDFDYYYTKSEDLVMEVPQGPSTGIGTLTTNAGKLKNSGIEIGISADIFHRKNFTWTSSFNITTARNKVISLAEGVDNILGQADSGDITNITLPGYSVGQIYALPTGGIDPSNGRRVFYGANGERTTYDAVSGKYYLNDGTEYTGTFEQVRCGNTLPTWFGGWTNTFRFYGVDVTIFMQFSGGNWIANGTRATVSDYRWWNNSKDVMENSWRKPGDKAIYAKPVYGDNVSNGSANLISDWVERGDYLRMKNICIGYTFNTKKWNQKIGISALRVYAQVQNAFVITGYSGFDPETITFTGNSTLQGGYDKNTMPQARTWTAGVSLTF